MYYVPPILLCVVLECMDQWPILFKGESQSQTFSIQLFFQSVIFLTLRKCMFLLLFLAWQLNYDIMLISEQQNDTDEHGPYCESTYILCRLTSWQLTPLTNCQYDTLCLHSVRFLSQVLCTDNSCSLQGQCKLSQFIYCAGRFEGDYLSIFCWLCCKFCKKIAKEKEKPQWSCYKFECGEKNTFCTVSCVSVTMYRHILYLYWGCFCLSY